MKKVPSSSNIWSNSRIEVSEVARSWTERRKVESQNAFIGKTTKPSEKELVETLDSSADAWKALVDWLAEEHAVTTQEWKSYSAKTGWSLRLKLKKRTILYMIPYEDSFQVALILGGRAMEAAKQSNLSKSLVKVLEEAPRYPEGTGIRLKIKATKDLAAVRKLAEIKLAN